MLLFAIKSGLLCVKQDQRNHTKYYNAYLYKQLLKTKTKSLHYLTGSLTNNRSISDESKIISYLISLARDHRICMYISVRVRIRVFFLKKPVLVYL